MVNDLGILLGIHLMAHYLSGDWQQCFVTLIATVALTYSCAMTSIQRIACG